MENKKKRDRRLWAQPPCLDFPFMRPTHLHISHLSVQSEVARRPPCTDRWGSRGSLPPYLFNRLCVPYAADDWGSLISVFLAQ